MKKLYKRLIIAGVIIALIPATLFILDSNKLVTTSYDVYSDNLPSSFDGFKLVQVSDFHNEAIEYSNRSIVESIIEEDPDVIVLTGDFIDEYMKNLDRVQAFFSGLEDYIILYENGNHDIRADLYEDFLVMCSTYGVINVSGGRYAFTNGEDQLAIIGVSQEEVDDDWRFTNINIDPVLYEHIEPLMDASDDYSILLSHHPDFSIEAAGLGFDLMLSGHYHGGHINLFGWSPAELIDEKYGGGLYDVSGMDFIMSRGAGSGFFPIRINCPAEIVSITLKTIA